MLILNFNVVNVKIEIRFLSIFAGLIKNESNTYNGWRCSHGRTYSK